MPLLTKDAEIRALLRDARTIAVVGLSDRPDRDSYRVARYMQHQGYRIIPVNPTIRSVLGEESLPGLTAVGEPVDIVDVFRRPEHLSAIVEDAIRLGARALWTQLGVVHDAAVARASAAGLLTVVDRCLLVEHRRLGPFR